MITVNSTGQEFRHVVKMACLYTTILAISREKTQSLGWIHRWELESPKALSPTLCNPGWDHLKTRTPDQRARICPLHSLESSHAGVLKLVRLLSERLRIPRTGILGNKGEAFNPLQTSLESHDITSAIFYWWKQSPPSFGEREHRLNEESFIELASNFKNCHSPLSGHRWIVLLHGQQIHSLPRASLKIQLNYSIRLKLKT